MNNSLVKTIDNAILKAGPQFTSMVSKYNWAIVPDSQLQAAKSALTKSDYIMKIAAQSPDDVHDAIVKAGILGVDLTDGKRQAYLLPRKNSAGNTVIQLQVGYKGVEAIHQRMGVIDRLSIRVVRKKDDYDWCGDDAVKPTHNPGRFLSDDERGPIDGAFAITYYPDGSIQTTVASISEIYEKHRDVSDSWKSYQSKLKSGSRAFPPPWVTHEKSMIEKTMAYIAAKQWPANYRDPEVYSNIASTLHEVDTADYVELSSGYTPEQKAAFHEMIESNDCLGIFLLEHYMKEKYGEDVYPNLFNSFEKGTKTKKKDTVRKMTASGVDIFNLVCEELPDGDLSAVAENIEDCLPSTITMLKRRLEADKLNAFEEVIAQL